MAFDLDICQQDAWEAYLAHKNVALFGRAGSGKSVVLRRCIAHAQRMHGVNNVGIVAWTTHAASLIGGMTMHKLLRIGIAELPKEAILEKVRSNVYTKEKLKSIKVIVIDELPQMASRWLVVFEYVVRQMALPHKQSMPWGGCQVVVGGDTLQLGPVSRKRQLLDPPVYMCRTFRDTFLSRFGSRVILDGSHRQSSSGWLSGCLDRIRVGTATAADLRILNATSSGVSERVWESHTQLRAVNAQVNEFNNRQLRKLTGLAVVYKSQDELNTEITHPMRQEYAWRAVKDLAPPEVALKPGAVVLTTRAVHGVATATQGVVVKCLPTHVVCMLGGVEVDVAPAAFDLVDNRGQHLATRLAMPLILGWAMTIHRAQGATLDTLAVDFSDLCWREVGLVYTALSRCRLLEGLLVRGLRIEHIVVSADALKFYGL